MQGVDTAVTVKSAGTAATAAAAAFGLTWWAIAAAIAGGLASLHFEKPAAGSKVRSVLLQVFAMGFFAALLAVILPHLPGFGWTAPQGLLPDVSLAVRAGLLGAFANPIVIGVRALIAAFLARRTAQGG